MSSEPRSTAPPAAADSSDERPLHPALGFFGGADGQVGSTIYGTLVVLTATTAGYAAERHRPGHLIQLVIGAVLVFWLTYVYAHALSESIERKQRLSRHTILTVAHEENGILLAAVPPVCALFLGTVGLVDESFSIWLAVALGILVLIVEGYRYSRIEQLSLALTVAIIATNVAIGFAVVLLKLSFVH